MDLNKILAENMLRFGVKNLSEISRLKLNEQAIATAVEYNLAQMPAILQSTNYKPDPLKYIAIPDGNPWLAANRAVSLKNFLVANIQKQLNIPFDAKAVTIAETAVSPNKGDEYQYVEGSIYGKMSKPPKEQAEYPYNIKYNWYDINGVPYIIITKIGKGAPSGVLQYGVPQAIINQMKNQMPADGILVQESVGGGGPNRDYRLSILLPITKEKFKWTALKNGTMYFTDQNAYDTAKTYIMSYTQEAAGNGGEADIKKNSTFTSFTGNLGGAGNYIGKGGKGSTVTILAGTGTGNVISIKTMWVGKDGDVPGEIKTGDEGKWVQLGAFQLGKGDGSFLDNMITLQPGSYQKVFDSIKTEVDKQKAENLQIDSITATIKGYASADRATNRLPKGVAAPDHTYGGHVPVQYWIRQ